MQPRRYRSTLAQVVLGAILVGLLVMGAFHATQAGPDNTYPALDLFTEVLNKVQTLYVKDVDPKKLVYTAIDGMLQNLDSHSSFMTPEMMKEMRMQITGKYGGLGMQIGKVPNGPIRIEGVFEDTPAARAGLKVKDIILKIDGKDTSSMTSQDAANNMRGDPKTNVKLLVKRDEWPQPKELTLTREVISLKSVRKTEVLDGQYGYVHLAAFQQSSSDELNRALNKIEKNPGIKGLILDLRNNPGGPLQEAINVSDLFLTNGLIVGIKGRPGQNRDNKDFFAQAQGTHPAYPIIVIVNEGTASASEIVAGALQDHGRAVILGTKTFGKGSVQTILELKDGSGLRLTTALYYTPSGRSIQATGIVPDIIVEQPAPQMQASAGNPQNMRRVRESDLPHHFQNPNEVPPGQVPPTAPGVEEQDEEQMETPIPAKAQQDVQLQRALDLLKTWTIFQGVQQKRATADAK